MSSPSVKPVTSRIYSFFQWSFGWKSPGQRLCGHVIATFILKNSISLSSINSAVPLLGIIESCRGVLLPPTCDKITIRVIDEDSFTIGGGLARYICYGYNSHPRRKFSWGKLGHPQRRCRTIWLENDTLYGAQCHGSRVYWGTCSNVGVNVGECLDSSELIVAQHCKRGWSEV